MKKENTMMSSVSVSLIKGALKNNEVIGTSGIIISENWILTHGALLKMTRDKKLIDLVSNLIPGQLTLLPIVENDNLHVHVQLLTNKKIDNMSRLQITDDNNFNIHQINGAILAAWRCPLLVDALANIFYSWEFGRDFQKINKLLSSVFLVISLNNKDYNNDNSEINSECDIDERVRNVLSHFIDNNSNIYENSLTRGAIINIESTPFGNSVFINSISQGIVSNVLGINECVMLTDANTVPGCEGGPVYVVQKDGSQLVCGMVIAPLSWCRNEWVNYTLVACFLPCLRKLLKKQEIRVDITEVNENLDFTNLLDDSVVFIRCGVNWGSGILLNRDSGIILTCAHVVNEASNHQISVTFNNKHRTNAPPNSNKLAELIYRTPRDLPYDIALLKVNPLEIDNNIRSLSLGKNVAIRGEKIISAGFPFISSQLPTITQGIISSVSPYMIQTTCCVQSGASGGPIIRPTTGELLGIIACNVITSNTLYPRLNMAIPTIAICDPINKYIETNRIDVLESLLTHDPNVLRMWNFHLSSKI